MPKLRELSILLFQRDYPELDVKYFDLLSEHVLNNYAQKAVTLVNEIFEEVTNAKKESDNDN